MLMVKRKGKMVFFGSICQRVRLPRYMRSLISSTENNSLGFLSKLLYHSVIQVILSTIKFDIHLSPAVNCYKVVSTVKLISEALSLHNAHRPIFVLWPPGFLSVSLGDRAILSFWSTYGSSYHHAVNEWLEEFYKFMFTWSPTFSLSWSSQPYTQLSFQLWIFGWTWGRNAMESRIG